MISHKLVLFLLFSFNVAAAPAVPPQIPPQVPQQVDDCYYDNGSNYRGTAAVTTTGKKCQAWISMWPHRHLKTPSAFPDA